MNTPQFHRAVVLGLTGSPSGWPDQKGGTSSCADAVIE
jgi:hypothetical protein